MKKCFTPLQRLSVKKQNLRNSAGISAPQPKDETIAFLENFARICRAETCPASGARAALILN